MWTPADRALVEDFGSGQALTDDQFRLLEPLIPPAKSGGRPRSTDIRRVLDGLFYLVRTGCQWRHVDRRPTGTPAKVGFMALILLQKSAWRWGPNRRRSGPRHRSYFVNNFNAFYGIRGGVPIGC